MPVKKRGFVYWASRILSIIFILFLALFSLDVFEEGRSALWTAAALFIHNIPSIILLVVLIISWKREIVGGVVFIAGGIFYVVLIATRSEMSGHAAAASCLTIAVPALFIGILFIIGWIRKKKQG